MTSKTCLQNLGTVSSLTASKNLFVKLHGAFMIGAWVLFASVGMFLARYFKQDWTAAKCCKLDQWFIWHRFFMVTTWGLTIAGVILIFLELQVGLAVAAVYCFDQSHSGWPMLLMKTSR